MTDPIGTAQERELIERLRKFGRRWNMTGVEAADALQSRIAEVGRLEALLRECRSPVSSWMANTNNEESSLLARIDAALSLQRRV